MARTKATLGSGARLTDYLSTSLLARVFPSPLISELLDKHGCNSQRQRSLPAAAGVYYCMALSLYPEAAYGDVFDAVAQGLAWQSRSNAALARIKASSISNARTRLSWPILKDLQERACQALALAQSCPSAFYRGLRLMAIDGSNFDVPDEPANVAAFGYPGSRTGVAGYPQAQCAILVECATHAIVGANIGAYRDAEWTLAKPLLGRLDASMLCLADRGFNGYEHWCAARATVESVFDELKTHLHQSRRVLRSKTPDLVRQEFYGWVLAHYAVRWLMHSAGSRYDLEPRQLSFVANVQHLRAQQLQSGAFPPSAPEAAQALV